MNRSGLGGTRTRRPAPAQRRRILPAAAACLVAALGCATHADLRLDVELAIKTTVMPGAKVAVSICDTQSSRTLVSVNAAVPMIPASNMKLFTSGAALHVLGPDFEFVTRLLRDGDRLIVVGDGDPGFADPYLLDEMQIGDQDGIDLESFLQIWVTRVVGTGLKSISEIVVDDRVFDREFVHPTWPVDQLNRRYCAQIAGLNFHLNLLHFYPRPRKGMRPDITIFEPAARWLKLTNRATSNDGVHDNNTAWIARQIGTNNLTFLGNVKFPYRSPVPVTVHDMPAFFVRLLAARLEAAGVEVGGYRLIGMQEPPSGGELVAAVRTPMSTVMTRCNRDSCNLYAECLLKRMGAALTPQSGSWINGSAILRHVIHERLADPTVSAKVLVADGSGLSRENRVTAESITAWLNTFPNDERLGPTFIGSLAVAGKTGTLRKRFKNKNAKLHGALIQGKSGFINNVSTFSGYVTMPDGQRRSFSILVNGFDGPARPAKKLQETIVVAIAADMAAAVALGLGGE